MIKKFDGSNFVDISSIKKFDGSNFVDAENVKRFDGLNWVDCWSNKQKIFVESNEFVGYNSSTLTVANNGKTLKFLLNAKDGNEHKLILYAPTIKIPSGTRVDLSYSMWIDDYSTTYEGVTIGSNTGAYSTIDRSNNLTLSFVTYRPADGYLKIFFYSKKKSNGDLIIHEMKINNVTINPIFVI